MAPITSVCENCSDHRRAAWPPAPTSGRARSGPPPASAHGAAGRPPLHPAGAARPSMQQTWTTLTINGPNHLSLWPGWCQCQAAGTATGAVGATRARVGDWPAYLPDPQATGQDDSRRKIDRCPGQLGQLLTAGPDWEGQRGGGAWRSRTQTWGVSSPVGKTGTDVRIWMLGPHRTPAS